MRVQYLGARGSTIPCVAAIVSILTSPSLPDRFTVVFEKRDYRKEKFTVAAFVAWDWLMSEVTVVPDGYGTHGGTGGWGLSLCLALIQASSIRLDEVHVTKAVFDRLCNGDPTDKDIQTLKMTEHGAPDWPCHVYSSHDSAIEDGSIWDMIQPYYIIPSRRLPVWILGPDAYRSAKTFETNSTGAISDAMVTLEQTIREMSGFTEMYGSKLFNSAFGENGPLRFKRPQKAESDSWQQLYASAYGAIRNPLGHRKTGLKQKEAIRYLMVADMLITQLHAEHPRKSRKFKRMYIKKIEWRKRSRRLTISKSSQ